MPQEIRPPGFYITIRVDKVAKRYQGNPGFEMETETLVDATDQNFTPFVMAAMLRAVADEIYPPKPQF
jgi:hypothetical protein